MIDRSIIVHRLGAPPRPGDVLECEVSGSHRPRRVLVLETCRCRECSTSSRGPDTIRITENRVYWEWRGWGHMQQEGWVYAGTINGFQWAQEAGAREFLVPLKMLPDA